MSLDSIVPFLQMLDSPGYQAVLLNNALSPEDWRFYTSDVLWIRDHQRFMPIHRRILHSIEDAAGIPLIEVPVELSISPVACFVRPVNWVPACYLIGQERLHSAAQIRAAANTDLQLQDSIGQMPAPRPRELYAYLWQQVATADFTAHHELISSIITAVTSAPRAGGPTGPAKSLIPVVDE